MIPLVNERREAIGALCARYGVRRLDLFGSAAKGGFDPAVSDVDFVVEFAPETDLGPWFARYFDLKSELETLLERPVDLVMAGVVSRFAGAASTEQESFYAA